MTVAKLINLLVDEDPDFEVRVMEPGGHLLKVLKVEPWWDLTAAGEQEHLVMIVGERR